MKKLVSLTLLAVAVAVAVGSPVAGGDSKAVVAAARKYVAAHSAVPEFRVKDEKIEGDYARVRLIPKHRNQADPAWVFLKRENGDWRGLTMGTYFTAEDYDKFQIPLGIRP